MDNKPNTAQLIFNGHSYTIQWVMMPLQIKPIDPVECALEEMTSYPEATQVLNRIFNKKVG